MKLKLTIILISTISVNVLGVNPSYTSFNTNQFTNTGGTNNIVIKNGALTTNLVLSGSVDGINITNVTATRLFNQQVNAYALIYTNIGGQPDMLLLQIPASQQTNGGDDAIIVCTPRAGGSTGGGFFFPAIGTNVSTNGYFRQVVLGVLPSGATNGIIDTKAMQIGFTPINNVSDINAGAGGTFMNPHWPLYTGGFSSAVTNVGSEYDMTFQDFDNGIFHFPSFNPPGGNGDPRSIGFGLWDTMSINESNSTVTMSNVIIRGANLYIGVGSIGIKNQMSIGTTNATATTDALLISKTGADLGVNYPQLTIKQTASGWGPNIALDAIASSNGRKFGLNSTGASDPAGAGWMTVYDFTLNDYIFKMGSTGHGLQIPNGTISAPLIIGTNGYVSYATNQFAFAATGWTNTTGSNCVVAAGSTAVAATLSDGTNTIRTTAVLTGELPAWILKPNWKVTASGGLVGVAYPQ